MFMKVCIVLIIHQSAILPILQCKLYFCDLPTVATSLHGETDIRHCALLAQLLLGCSSLPYLHFEQNLGRRTFVLCSLGSYLVPGTPAQMTDRMEVEIHLIYFQIETKTVRYFLIMFCSFTFFPLLNKYCLVNSLITPNKTCFTTNMETNIY